MTNETKTKIRTEGTKYKPEKTKNKITYQIAKTLIKIIDPFYFSVKRVPKEIIDVEIEKAGGLTIAGVTKGRQAPAAPSK